MLKKFNFRNNLLIFSFEKRQTLGLYSKMFINYSNLSLDSALSCPLKKMGGGGGGYVFFEYKMNSTITTF